MSKEITYEEEAEKMAETAEKLAKQNQRDRQIPKQRGVYQLPVVGAEKEDSEIIFTVLLGGDEKREVSVRYPDDTEDSSEPLVRLLEWKGLSFQQFAQIGEVPVYTDGEDSIYQLCVPSQEAFDYPILTDERISQYRVSGTDVLMTQKPIYWLLAGSVSLILASALGILTVDSVQELVRFNAVSVDTLIFMTFTFLLLTGFRSLWRAADIKYQTR